jgi:hypothetical protein
MTRTLIIAALTALVATSPAAAADRKSAPDKENRIATEKGKQTKYCLAYEKTTGSRIERTECRTKAEWAEEGIDLDDLDS